MLAEHRRRFRSLLPLHLTGNAVSASVTTWEFWFAVAVFVAVRINLSAGNAVVAVDSSLVGTIGGCLSFLLVFYNNQVYSRYTTQFHASMEIENRIFNSTYWAREYMPIARAWQFVRYLNAAHILTYVGLSKTYGYSTFFLPVNDELKMLTAEEIKRLDELGFLDLKSAAYREVLCWATSLIRRNGAKDTDLMLELTALRKAISTLYEHRNQPIPFAYFHLVNILVLVYLPLFSYFVATSYDAGLQYGTFAAALAVFLNNIFTIGLLETCKLMSDPYGDDSCDFKVAEFVYQTMKQCRKILKGRIMDDTPQVLEETLEKNRPKMQKTGKIPSKPFENFGPVVHACHYDASKLEDIDHLISKVDPNVKVEDAPSNWRHFRLRDYLCLCAQRPSEPFAVEMDEVVPEENYDDFDEFLFDGRMASYVSETTFVDSSPCRTE